MGGATKDIFEVSWLMDYTWQGGDLWYLRETLAFFYHLGGSVSDGKLSRSQLLQQLDNLET